MTVTVLFVSLVLLVMLTDLTASPVQRACTLLAGVALIPLYVWCVTSENIQATSLVLVARDVLLDRILIKHPLLVLSVQWECINTHTLLILAYHALRVSISLNLVRLIAYCVLLENIRQD